MKKIFSMLLLLPALSFAQDFTFEEQWGLAKPDSNYKRVSLPKVWISDLRVAYEVGHQSSYQYKVTHDTMYRKIFARYHKDSLPVFDFSSQELVANISCIFCRRSGNYDNKPRHRNACSYNVFWYLREKK